jgi:hypothetical protein
MKIERNKEKEEKKKKEKWTEAAQYRNISAHQTFPNHFSPFSLSPV